MHWAVDSKGEQISEASPFWLWSLKMRSPTETDISESIQSVDGVIARNNGYISIVKLNIALILELEYLVGIS